MSGGGAGTGIGSLLGTLAGVALAPATGGLSMLIPAATGAAGAEVGNLATGNTQNPLMAALMGGVSGGLGGYSGLGDTLGIGNAGGVGDSIQSAAPSWLGGSSPASLDSIVNGTANPVTAGTQDLLSQMGLADPASETGISAAVSPTAATAPSTGSGITGWLGKQNPLSLALAGTTGLSAIQSLMPHKQVNVGQNAANVMATNPDFNAALPKYTQQNTGTPYSGDWYKDGYSPQPAMYNAMPQQAKHGGMIRSYAHGGAVRGYAAGGMPLAAPQMAPQGAPPAMPPQGMPPRPQAAVNPLALAAAHKVGVAIGQHLRKTHMTPPGKVSGAGGGQDDAIPAKLSDGEYIVPSESVSQLGDGSTNAGAKKLDAMVHHIRAHKTSKGSAYPPKAKNPLSYLKGA